MPRYFFNLADGSCIRDPGEELPGLEQAQSTALLIAAETLPLQQNDLVPTGEFSVFVTDGEGTRLWSVRVTTGEH